MAALTELAYSLYSRLPPNVLFHYTSIDAVLKIVPEAALWATDIHYLNDASELTHALEHFEREALILMSATQSESPEVGEILRQMAEWFRALTQRSQSIFVACFSASGNLLSQWRGYTPHGKGVSLGFLGEQLWAHCTRQQFWFGRCIYDSDTQSKVSRQVVRIMLTEAQQIGPDQAAYADQSFFSRFELMALEALQIASLFKSFAFAAEDEWRAVSHFARNTTGKDVKYRAGGSTLVPYLSLSLPQKKSGGLELNQVIVGPTPHGNLAITALANFLSDSDARATHGVHACSIPYRQT